MEFPWHSCWFWGYPADRNTTFFEEKNKNIVNTIKLSKEPWDSDINLTSYCTVTCPETVLSFYAQKMSFKQTYHACHRVVLPRLQRIHLFRSTNVSLQIHRSCFYCVLVYCSPVHQLIASFDAFATFPNCDFDFCQVWWALPGLWD